MEISGIVKRQREYFATGATRKAGDRIAVLKKLQQAIRAHEEELCDAMQKDL